MDIIDQTIATFTPAQLRQAARAGMVAEAYLWADAEGRTSEHTDAAHDALGHIPAGSPRITFEKYQDAVWKGEKPEDVASANWHRRLLNIVPLTDEWEEQDPSTFIGYLGDNHTLPRPPLEVCENYAARLPWVQTNLLHGPSPIDTPVYRQLERDVVEADDQCRRGFAHADVRDRAHSNLAGWTRRHLADLAVFTANLPDELFIP